MKCKHTVTDRDSCAIDHCPVCMLARIAELERLMASKSTFELLKENADQQARIAELEKELDDLRQYLHTGEMPKENE